LYRDSNAPFGDLSPREVGESGLSTVLLNRAPVDQDTESFPPVLRRLSLEEENLRRWGCITRKHLRVGVKVSSCRFPDETMTMTIVKIDWDGYVYLNGRSEPFDPVFLELVIVES